MSKSIALRLEEQQAIEDWEPVEALEAPLDDRTTRDLFRMLGDLYPLRAVQTRNADPGPKPKKCPAVKRAPINVATTT